MEGSGLILLDTHSLIWMDQDNPALGATARELIEMAWREGLVAVSAISFWETAMLVQRARITLPVSVETWRSDLLEAGVKEIHLDGRIMLRATQLQGLLRDPADRFILATALQSSATLITADHKMLGWEHQLPRQDARL